MNRWSAAERDYSSKRREGVQPSATTRMLCCEFGNGINGISNVTTDCTKTDGNSMGHEERLTSDNQDFVTTTTTATRAFCPTIYSSSTTSEDFRLLPAGTSLLNNDVTGSSTSFGLLQKEETSALVCGSSGCADSPSSRDEGGHSVTRRRLDFDEDLSSSSSSVADVFQHTEHHHHQQQQQEEEEEILREEPVDVKDSATIYRPWEVNRSSSVVVRPWELSPVFSIHQRPLAPSFHNGESTATNSVNPGLSVDHADSGYFSHTPDPVTARQTRQPAAERKSGSFESATIRLLETWYAANIRHPYPDDVTTAALATGGGISVKQVRKWLANRRVRSCNTLTYNGAVHPRRLRRLRRQPRHMVDVESTAARQPLHSTPVQTPVVGPSPSAAGFQIPGFFQDSAFQTLTPLSATSCRRRNHFDIDTDFTTKVLRHHPYEVRNVTTVRTEALMPPTVTPLTHRTAYFTAATAVAASLTSARQMATQQLNVFNVFN